MEVIKISYYPLHMQNERNWATSVHGNGTVNTPVPILHTGLWPSSEMCGCHMLNVVHPYSLQEVWRSEILPNHRVIPDWKIFFSRIFFFFCVSYQKITQPISQSTGWPQLLQLINQWSKTNIYIWPKLLGPSMIIDKNINFSLIHIPSGKL